MAAAGAMRTPPAPSLPQTGLAFQRFRLLPVANWCSGRRAAFRFAA